MTEDKTTITDNEVIGAFDGREDGYDEHGVWQKLKYESDWRDLMPVWYKFRDLKFENGEHTWKKYDLAVNIVYAICWEDIGEACRLLAEGIRWYNSTQNNNEKQS